MAVRRQVVRSPPNAQAPRVVLQLPGSRALHGGRRGPVLPKNPDSGSSGVLDVATVIAASC